MVHCQNDGECETPKNFEIKFPHCIVHCEYHIYFPRSNPGLSVENSVTNRANDTNIHFENHFNPFIRHYTVTAISGVNFHYLITAELRFGGGGWGGGICDVIKGV